MEGPPQLKQRVMKQHGAASVTLPADSGQRAGQARGRAGREPPVELLSVLQASRLRCGRCEEGELAKVWVSGGGVRAVSYTHLTLPTKRIV